MLRRSTNDVVSIRDYIRNILNDEVLWTHNLSETSHPVVQLVTRIRSAGVVIQIAMTLARWSAHSDIDARKALPELLLSRRKAIAKFSIYDLPYISLEPTLLAKVLSVRELFEGDSACGDSCDLGKLAG
jgi:hypothetical protein